VRLVKNKLSIEYSCLRDGFACPYFSFYKEDVLLSFFSLTPDDSKTHISRVQHFRSDSDYTKAHVSVHKKHK
jgi:hypothetical protein